MSAEREAALQTRHPRPPRHPGDTSTMFRLLACLALLVALGMSLVPARAQQPKLPTTLGSIERKDPKFDALIPKDAKIEVLAGGIKWAEGPVWDKKANALLFTDIPNNRVMKWSAEGRPDGLPRTQRLHGQGGVQGGGTGSQWPRLRQGRPARPLPARRPPRRPARQGRQVIRDTRRQVHGQAAEQPQRPRLRQERRPLLHRPALWPARHVTIRRTRTKELDFQGVYRLTPKGELTLLTKEMTRPNGIGLSPDEKTLYVANSDPDKAIWMAFPIKDDGTLGPGKMIHDATADVKAHPEKGLPDGLKVDQKGNIFATAVNGVYVFSPDYKLLGKIVTNDKTANCAWGDDGTVLYLATNDMLTRVKTTTKGLGF